MGSVGLGVAAANRNVQLAFPHLRPYGNCHFPFLVERPIIAELQDFAGQAAKFNRLAKPDITRE